MKYNIGPQDSDLKLLRVCILRTLMSAVSDRDVVNLFYGFLSGPENLPTEFDGMEVTSKLAEIKTSGCRI